LSRSERDGSGIGAPGRIVTFTAATAEAQAGDTGKPKGRHCARESHRTAPLPWRKPAFDSAQLDIIRDMLAQDASPTAIAQAAAVSRQVVYRVQEDAAKAEAMLSEWGCRRYVDRQKSSGPGPS
jgi:DNA invertase Pin-like site-specific DNA recombinase